jgi:ATPase family associated with various cellular activities (AAA)
VQTQLTYAAQTSSIIAPYLLKSTEALHSSIIDNSILSSILLDIKESPRLANRDALVSGILSSIYSQAPSSGCLLTSSMTIPSKFAIVIVILMLYYTLGIVLYGESGTGKTSLAYTIAYKTSKTHRTLSVSCAELVHKVIGESEKKLTEIFSMARAISPCILILDNLDTVMGTKIDDYGGSSSSGIVYAIIRIY